MRNFNAKTVKIVDLKSGNIVEVGELAAEVKCKTPRFEYPDKITLTFDATEKQRRDLKNAIDFNNGVVSTEMEKVSGLEFVDEPKAETKPEKVKPVEKAIEKELELQTDLSSFTLKELKQYAQDNGIDITGLTTKKAILKELEQK